MASNFEFMAPKWRDIAAIGAKAEECEKTDPKSCAGLLQQIGERIADELLAVNGLTLPDDATQSEKIKFLRSHQLIIVSIEDILLSLGDLSDDTEITAEEAGNRLRMAHKLCHWFVLVHGYNDSSVKVSEPDDNTKETEAKSDSEEPATEEETQPDPEEPAAEEETQPDPEEPAAEEETQPDLEEPAAEEETQPDLEESAAEEEPQPEPVEQADEEEQKTEPEAIDEACDKIHIEANLLPVVNYALLQNGLRIIRSLSITSDSEKDIQDIELRITSEPAFCVPYSEHIDTLSAGRTLTLNNVKIIPDGNYLAGMSEKTSGVLTISLVSGEKTLCSQQTEISALAFDQWHGISLYPELLCAFITPNHPVIAQITARAAELLGKWTGDPSLDAYQSNDSNRVLKQAAAVYGALQEQNIVYCVPPASFEAIGQRIRLCDAIMEQKLGTCMDLTLFYSAVLEAIGLHPLLILLEGHIFAGVWLEEMSFPETVQDDASLITKRLANGINEIAVVECTAFAAKEESISFDDAQKAAEKQLADLSAIECFIDVNRARLSGVKPIPMRIPTENGWKVERPLLVEDELTAAPKDKSGAVLTDEPEDDTPVTRKTRWERKLLDLGLRNSLINLRLSKTLIPLLSSSVDDLEDSLSEGEDFKIMPRPTDLPRSFSRNSRITVCVPPSMKTSLPRPSRSSTAPPSRHWKRTARTPFIWH